MPYGVSVASRSRTSRDKASRRRAPLALTLTCASGGRPDHALAVVGQLASCAESGATARVVEDGYEMRVLASGGERSWRLGECAAGRTFSAIALAPGTRIDERGMRWELSDHPMELLGDLGVSNVIEGGDAEVTCRSGAVAAFLLRA